MAFSKGLSFVMRRVSFKRSAKLVDKGINMTKLVALIG